MRFNSRHYFFFPHGAGAASPLSRLIASGSNLDQCDSVAHTLVQYKAITTNKSEGVEMLLASDPCRWVAEPSPRICSELKRGVLASLGDLDRQLVPLSGQVTRQGCGPCDTCLGIITRHRMRGVKMEVSIGLATEFAKGGRSGCVSWINCSRCWFWLDVAGIEVCQDLSWS